MGRPLAWAEIQSGVLYMAPGTWFLMLPTIVPVMTYTNKRLWVCAFGEHDRWRIVAEKIILLRISQKPHIAFCHDQSLPRLGLARMIKSQKTL